MPLMPPEPQPFNAAGNDEQHCEKYAQQQQIHQVGHFAFLINQRYTWILLSAAHRKLT